MDVVRPRHTPRIPSRVPTEHADVLREPIPPVGALPAGRHRASLAYNGPKEGVSAPEQGSACLRRKEAFQRLWNSRKRRDSRLPPQGQVPRQPEIWQAKEAGLWHTGSRPMTKKGGTLLHVIAFTGGVHSRRYAWVFLLGLGVVDLAGD